MNYLLQSCTLWVLVCGLQALQAESLFSQADQDAIATVIGLARQYGVTDTTGGKLVWDDLKLVYSDPYGTTSDRQAGPHIRLPDGSWLIGSCWPNETKLTISPLAGERKAANWLTSHALVIVHDDDGNDHEMTALQDDIDTRLKDQLTEQHKQWLQTIGTDDFPTAVSSSQVGLIIAHLWNVDRSLAERLLVLSLFRMSMHRWDTWFSAETAPLALTRIQVGSTARDAWMGDLNLDQFGPLYKNDASTPLLKPDMALRLLLVSSFRTAITLDYQLQDTQALYNDKVHGQQFIKVPAPQQALTAIEALLPATSKQAQNELRRLRALIDSKEKAGKADSLISRLKQWRSYWPDSATKVQRHGFYWFGTTWSKRMPPVSQNERRDTDTYPFNEADMDSLFAALSNTALCHWYDDSTSRTIGDNALRALAGLLGADPRYLVQEKWDIPWTAEAQHTTAKALQDWRTKHAELSISDIRIRLIPSMSCIDLAWHVDRSSGEERDRSFARLATLWTTKPPFSGKRFIETHEDMANYFDAPKLMALVLNRAGTHAGIERAMSTWKLIGSEIDILAIHHFRHKQFDKLTQGLKQQITNKQVPAFGRLLTLGYDQDMIDAERAWLAKHLHPDTKQLDKIYLPTGPVLLTGSEALHDISHADRQAIMKHLSWVRLAIVQDALKDKRPAPACLQKIIKQAHHYAKEADIQQLSIGMALAILITEPMDHTMAEALQGAVDGAYPWSPRLDRSAAQREKSLQELIRLVPTFLPQESIRAGLINKEAKAP